MTDIQTIVAFLFFPSGLFVVLCGLAYEWVDRKVIARLQSRIGPRWFQPVADILKLLAKEEIEPQGVNRFLFSALPAVGLAGALTAALYVPLAGLQPSFSFNGDLIVVLYLLSLLTICIGLAGVVTANRYSVIGATRVLTQVFSYEAPFLLALLGPAMVTGSWAIQDINAFVSNNTWLVVLQPLGFIVAMIGLMGKLELPPFDAPEAETEIVAGALTEYSGRGLALFKLGKSVELIVGLTLVAAFFLGGINNPLDFLLKTLGLLLVMAGFSAVMTRFRIDQVVNWWRYGALIGLGQMLIVIAWQLWKGL
ncbi:MAG: NADH-quinone oxidoreductase subunit H [Anaerolineales bacterium]|jgi:NADH-quinone oxidoreductase subunit H|nr:NADH-quinone oxidoreductase subunit H [Anaerolineales bacterium]